MPLKTTVRTWIMWLILTSAFSIAYFHRVSLSIVMDYIVLDLKIKEAALAGTLAGTYGFIYMLMQVPSGFLVGLWGPRKIVYSGLLVTTAGSVIFALSSSLPLAFLGRGMVSLGVSVVFVSIMRFQTNWFEPSLFATVSGFTLLIGNLGSVLGTVPLSLLVTRYGWRISFLFIGAITFLIALLCWLLVKDTPPTASSLLAKKEEAPNLHEDKHAVFTLSQSILKEFAGLRQVVKNPSTWALFLSGFAIGGSSIAFAGTWSITYLMQIYNFSRNQASFYMLILTIGNLIGFAITGIIADKIGRKKPFFFLFAFYIVSWSVLLLWGGRPPSDVLYIIFFFMGLSLGSQVMLPILARETNNPQFSELAISVVNTGTFVGMAVLQPFMGYILDLRWDGVLVAGIKVYPLEAFQLLFVSCLVILLVSFVCAVLKIKIKS